VAVEVLVEWRGGPQVPDRVRRKLQRLLKSLAPVLNEYEASLYDMANLASNGFEYLAPSIELALPLYDERLEFRLRMDRNGATRIALFGEGGEPVGEVFLE
jgi:hypothetical protein